ncbi:TetR family transcriptional regulator [Glaciihabitans sp. dw_435]|uniref:TetR family transcriptional regulator n=1 Tax=Glaciihabitans sp. dw_435 TaxID=2720081 RepID=UPI001BD1BD77|nr:TetR family transcriptional regulator [Glaciihabitans sp. dw_435]
MVKKLASSTRLRVSEECCELYLTRGTTQLTVADIAGSVGVSERTFYRYFPVKADSIGPVFDAMTEAMNAAVMEHPPAPIRDVVVDAFDAMFTTRITSRADEIFPLVLADPEMWGLFLRKVHDGEAALAPFLAARLSISVDSNRARAAAAAIASATRIALERVGTNDVELTTEFAGLLDAFGPPLLAPADAASPTSAPGSTS